MERRSGFYLDMILTGGIRRNLAWYSTREKAEDASVFYASFGPFEIRPGMEPLTMLDYRARISQVSA